MAASHDSDVIHETKSKPDLSPNIHIILKEWKGDKKTAEVAYWEEFYRNIQTTYRDIFYAETLKKQSDCLQRLIEEIMDRVNWQDSYGKQLDDYQRKIVTNHKDRLSKCLFDLGLRVEYKQVRANLLEPPDPKAMVSSIHITRLT
jgi:hypothetical protein